MLGCFKKKLKNYFNETSNWKKKTTTELYRYVLILSKSSILCILTRFTDNSFLFKSPRVLPSSFFCVLGFCNPMWFKCHTRVCQFLKSTSLYYITIKDQIYNSLYFNCSFFFSHKMIKQVMNEMKTVWKTCPSCYKATNIKMHLVLSFYTILEDREKMLENRITWCQRLFIVWKSRSWITVFIRYGLCPCYKYWNISYAKWKNIVGFMLYKNCRNL